MQYTNLIWRDGQPYSEMFDDIYYSSEEREAISGESEFNHVFFNSNRLPERWQAKKDFVIAELGFGSGLNCLLTIREWLKHLDESNENKCLHYIALEKYPLSPDAISQLIARYPELKEYCHQLMAVYPPAVKGSHSRHLFDNRVVIHYKFMDAYEALEKEQYNVDAWYLDGFSPAKNPDMWSTELFEKIAQNSHDNTTCSTYTAAGFVKRNLQEVGFEVSKVSGHGRKREMLVATFKATKQSGYKFSERPWFSQPTKPRVTDKKATVIGAGIAGLSVAYSLIKRGWLVTIIDKHAEVASGASSNPAAIVYPRLSVNNEADMEFYIAAYCYALYVLKLLQTNHQEKFWFDDGLLQLIDEKRISEIIDKYDFGDDFISRTNLGEQVDKIVIDDAKKIFIKYQSAGVVLPKILCDVLVEECGDQLTFINAELSTIKRSDNKWQCLRDDLLLDESEVLVIANGANINDCGLDVSFPVESIRGQVTVLEENSQSTEIDTALNSDFYITPSIAEKHYLGATYSRDNNDQNIDECDNQSLLSLLEKSCPEMFTKDSIAGAWVGFRSMSKDRVAIVGAVPDKYFYEEEYGDIKDGKRNKNYSAAKYLKGLYVNAAHGSRGFTSSFICAEIIAAQVVGEALPVSKTVLDYLQPSRFIVNDLKRR